MTGTNASILEKKVRISIVVSWDTLDRDVFKARRAREIGRAHV